MIKRLPSLILLCLLVAPPVRAQQMTANDVVGTWETQWEGAPSASTGARPLIEETLEFAKDGTFRRIQRSGSAPASQVTTMQGSYTVSLAPQGVLSSVTIRGTYDRGDRAGQTVSIVLRPGNGVLIATISPTDLGPTDISFTRSRTLDASYLRGTWVGEWTFAGTGPAGSVMNRETLIFKDGGTFERTTRALNVTAPTNYMDGTYTIDGKIIVIRGTFTGGARAGQMVSLTLKAAGDALETTLTPPGHHPVVLTLRKAE